MWLLFIHYISSGLVIVRVVPVSIMYKFASVLELITIRQEKNYKTIMQIATKFMIFLLCIELEFFQ